MMSDPGSSTQCRSLERARAISRDRGQTLPRAPHSEPALASPQLHTSPGCPDHAPLTLLLAGGFLAVLAAAGAGAGAGAACREEKDSGELHTQAGDREGPQGLHPPLCRPSTGSSFPRWRHNMLSNLSTLCWEAQFRFQCFTPEEKLWCPTHVGVGTW